MRFFKKLRVREASKLYLLCVALVVTSLPVLGQNVAGVSRRTERYEGGAGDNEVTEAAFRLTSLNPKERRTVAIRICSKERIVIAMATAAANPFQIADKFVNGYAYPPERVVFLRSEDCLSDKDPSISATEIWAIPEGATLPHYVEALTFNQIRLISLGRKPANRGVRDYKAALQKLIDNLRSNPKNFGVAVGYFLDRPSKALQQRMREVRTLLQQSGLPRERYLVHLTCWPDEVSTYPPDSEPRYPDVFVIEMANDSTQK